MIGLCFASFWLQFGSWLIYVVGFGGCWVWLGVCCIEFWWVVMIMLFGLLIVLLLCVSLFFCLAYCG